MSYLKDQIEMEKVIFDKQWDEFPITVTDAFDKGLLAGFRIAINAYGIWKNGVQRIGASDKNIAEASQEFMDALHAHKDNSDA